MQRTRVGIGFARSGFKSSQCFGQGWGGRGVVEVEHRPPPILPSPRAGNANPRKLMLR
jgi:hypothetical protein